MEPDGNTRSFINLIKDTQVGRYRIIERLGMGGMGEVYLAEDTDLKRQVALKFLSPSMATDSDCRTRFTREAQAVAKLNHPNIVTIHEVGEFQGRPFFAMEYVDGQSLRELIGREKLSLSRALDIAIQLCDGLQEAHAVGIIHRDVKPSNVLIDKKGHPKLLDFGLAILKGCEPLTRVGSTFGTAAYMSPEQVLGKDVDARSDIFSFGVVLYEMLAGALPFHGDIEAVVMYAIANDKAVPLSKHKPDIPDDLQVIVDKALQKNPEDRYQTVSEMATDLASLKRGSSEGRLIARASKPSKPSLSLKRKIIYAALAVIILSAAALLFINPFNSSVGKLKRVVVVPFKNQTGNAALDPLGRMVADWTTHGLAQSGMVESVPLEKVPDLEKKESIKEVVSATGADIIVMGSYYQLGDTIQFQAKVLDSDDKLLQAIDPISSLSEKAMDGVEGVRQKVMGTLAMLSEQRFGRLYSKPPIYEAYLQYIQGLDIFGGKTDKGVTNWASSIRYFEKSYSLDSSFFSPLFYIFAAHINLGQIAQADSVLQFLTIRRDRLSQMEQLDLEEYRCIISGDAMKALNVARERAKIAPGTGTYYRWGRAAFMAHRPRECIQVLRRIDSEDSLAGIYTWIFLCDAFHFIGDYKNALKTAKLGRRLYPASSNFLIHEIRDLAAIGKIADLRKVLEEAAEYDQGRDMGINMLNAAQDLRVHGHEDTAMAIYDEAIRWFERLSPEDMKLNRLVYGQALYGARRWQQALRVFEELDRGIADSLDPPEEILTARIWVGTTAARLGDKRRALGISEWLGNIKQAYRNGGPSYNRACIAAILGDKEPAVNFLKESAAQGYFALGRWMITDWDFDLESLRDYPPFQEFIRPKG